MRRALKITLTRYPIGDVDGDRVIIKAEKRRKSSVVAKSKGEVTTLQVQIIKTDTNLRIENNMSEKKNKKMTICRWP